MADPVAVEQLTEEERAMIAEYPWPKTPEDLALAKLLRIQGLTCLHPGCPGLGEHPRRPGPAHRRGTGLGLVAARIWLCWCCTSL